MHFTSFLASGVLGLASVAAADSMVISHNCAFTSCSTWAQFNTDFGSFEIDGHDGCRRPNVPYMLELCIDEGRQRAHFVFTGQGKRCLRLTSHEDGGCTGWNTCFTNFYEETPCTWRLATPEGEEVEQIEGSTKNGTEVKPRGRYARGQ